MLSGQLRGPHGLPSCRGLLSGRLRPCRAALTHRPSAALGQGFLGTPPGPPLSPSSKSRSCQPPCAQSAELSFSLLDIDGYTEAYRQHQRTVFDFERWEKHRSTARYLKHILDLPHSRMLRGMAALLLYVMGLATAVCLYQASFQAGVLPHLLPSLEIKSKEMLSLTSFALSLLLVFRTNASYERWDSARKMWGLVLNRSRDLVRQSLTWFPADKGQLRALFCRWVPAFSKALMCHLRKGEDVVKELEGILLPHEITAVAKATHRPNYVLQVLGEIIKAARLPPIITLTMEQNLTQFEDCLGGCERILRTPIPLSYAKHTSRFMVLWLTLLPFSLHGTCGWGTIPVCGIIAFLLLGVKEITVTIEEPFSVLALEAISNSVLTNARELQAAHGQGANGGADAPLSAAAIVASALQESHSLGGPNGAAAAVGRLANGAHGLNGVNGRMNGASGFKVPPAAAV